MATAIWPGLRSEELPRVTGSMPATTEGSTFTRAISLPGYLPSMVASASVPSLNLTDTWPAPSTTWLLVTMCPSVSMRKPEPEPSLRELGPDPRLVLTSTTAGLTRLYMLTTASSSNSTEADAGEKAAPPGPAQRKATTTTTPTATVVIPRPRPLGRLPISTPPAVLNFLSSLGKKF